VCLDGSDIGERIADHVGYVLHNESQHKITLLYIDKGQKINHEEIFVTAFTILIKHGIPPENIFQRVIESSRVVPSIIQTINRGEYGAVAVGWSGRSSNKGVIKWLAGETCRSILDNIDKTALWIVP